MLPGMPKRRRSSDTSPQIAFLCLALWCGLVTLVHAGPYAPAAGQAGSTAIWKDAAVFSGWASGYQNYAPGVNVDFEWRSPTKALGQALGDAFDVVSLGAGGRITLTFDTAIANGPGADFAVFENSFNDTFLELAWVEVSSDGNTFVRFPGISFTPTPIGAFEHIDPTNIDGFAGKYRQGYGTPFDLDIFSNLSIVDVDNITHVRIIDIIGDGREHDVYPSQFGGPHPIYDPTPTTGSAGFDLDAIGVINQGNPIAPPVPKTIPLPVMSHVMLALLLLGASIRRCMTPN